MVQATIDRIDDGIAVLITHGAEPERLSLPATILPAGCREGDVVRIEIVPDEPATTVVTERIREKITRLRNPDRSGSR